MHPILASPRRLLLYLLSWTPILALLVAVTWQSSGATWQQAAAALGPACALFAFVCLSPFYICRSRPIGLSSALNLFITFGGAALAGGLIFAWSAWQAALVLEDTAAFRGIARLRTHVRFWFAMGVLLYLLSAGLHYAALAVGASPPGRTPRRRSSHSGARGRVAGAPHANQPALPVQQSAFYLGPGHSGRRARPGNVLAPGRLPAQQPGAGRPRKHPAERRIGAGPQLPRSGAGSLRRTPARGRGNRAGVRSVRGPRSTATALGGECRQARHRRTGGRRAHPAGRPAARCVGGHHPGKRFRSRSLGAGQDGYRPLPRPPPATDSLWRRRRVRSRSQWRPLPRGPAISLRIAHGFEQPRVTGPAHRQAGAIGEDGEAALLPIGLDARHPLEVHDDGAVDAHEARRVERGLQAGDGLLLEVLLPAAVQRHVRSLKLHVVELVQGDYVYARPVLHHDALGPLPRRAYRGQVRRRTALPEPRFGPLQRAFEALGVERLQQVIRRLRVERPDGVLVVSGRENHGRPRLDQLQHFEAVELGHLHVQEQKVGRRLGDGLHGIEAVGALGRNLDFRMLA